MTRQPRRLLSPGLPIFEIAGSNPLGGAPVGLGDVVLDVVGPDAPHAPVILAKLGLRESCVMAAEARVTDTFPWV
jgi:hypothetical protein